jgi:energy-coupling factor transporter ATP-binding protein EcfA2
MFVENRHQQQHERVAINDRSERMNVRIGLDDAHAGVSIDAAARSRIALLGPPGCGKTTTCRYLVRRWLASTGGPCLLVTPRPYEYGNLDIANIEDPGRVSVPDQPSMLVVDEADLLDPGIVEGAVRSAHQLVIVASFGRAVVDLDSCDTGDDAAPVFDATYSLQHTPRADTSAVQCRLDWPANTIPVFLDQRRQSDFPLHKWAM